MEIFEKALREKLRYPVGNITVNTEDLWDLKLNQLDSVARNFYKKIKESEEVSFISDKPKSLAKDELAFEIVKYIINVKKEELKDREAAVEKRKQKELIVQIIERKKESELEGKSIEELQAMINE